mgnify:FL=1
MKNVEINTIYNIPEAVSGIGFISHFIGLSLYIVLFIFEIPSLLIDKNYLQDFLKSIQDSGVFVVLGMFFIFVLCPLYFLVRFFMELCRTKMARHKFYTTPNIKYITFNNNNLFFKNTIKNNDFSIMKSEIINAELKGIVRTITATRKSGAPLVTTFIENLTLTIETKDKKFIIYPAVKINQTKKQIIGNEEEIIKLQIDLYKKYFLYFVAVFESDNAPESTILAFKLNNYNS